MGKIKLFTEKDEFMFDQKRHDEYVEFCKKIEQDKTELDQENSDLSKECVGGETAGKPQTDVKVNVGSIGHLNEEDRVDEEPFKEHEFKFDVEKIKGPLFTSSKARVTYKLEDSPFAPTAKVLLSGSKVEERYMTQLMSSMFDPNVNISSRYLIEMAGLYRYLKVGEAPISLRMKGYTKKVPVFAKVLNEFFDKNSIIIENIYTMVNDELDTRGAIGE